MTKRILVKDVVLHEMNTDSPWEMVHMDNSKMYNLQDENKEVDYNDPIEVTKERIKKRNFFNDKGEHIVLGWTQRVQDYIDIPINCLIEENENKEETIEVLRAEIHGLRFIISERGHELSQYKNMGFWARLKFLFKGLK